MKARLSIIVIIAIGLALTAIVCNIPATARSQETNTDINSELLLLNSVQSNMISETIVSTAHLAVNDPAPTMLEVVTPTALGLASFEDSGIISLTGVYWSSVAWGDYDNDGDLDILLAGHTGVAPITKVYRNDGGNIFTDINATLAGVSSSSVAWGDYDNDGDLDILLTGAFIAKIYRNDGHGNFTDTGIALTGVSPGAAAWGDYDNDGDLDILLTGCTDHSCSSIVTKLYRNDGNGIFTDVVAALARVFHSSAAWGDYDNDGDLDILLVGNDGSSHISKIYRNDGNGIFTDIGAALIGVSPGSVAWGDYDNDADLDVLLTGRDNSNTYVAKVYRNDGNDIFTDISAALNIGGSGHSAEWGDYDNDGDLDILLVGDDNSGNRVAKIYRNDGSDTFADISAPLAGVAMGSVAWGDYDGDSDLDILLAGMNNSDILIAKIYRNNITTTNAVPSAPSDLMATVLSTSVTLRWNAASDAQTPANGLTYNLRVGTTPGGSQIVSAMANPATGYRQIPALGNTNLGLAANLKNLKLGTTYYWSVQAVDTAWTGSPFPAEASFVVPAPPSHVTITGPTVCAVNAICTLFACVSPVTTTSPVTYVWQATGQSPVTHTGGLSDTVAFTWSAPGVQTINVIATNSRDEVTDSHSITINLYELYLPLVLRNYPE